MANFGLNLFGLDKFSLQIRNLNEQLEKEVKTITRRTADRIVSEAKEIVPVDTGRLKASIRADSFDDGFGYRIIADTEYATFVEFGTIKMRAQPYLFPAYEKERLKYLDELKQALKRLG